LRAVPPGLCQAAGAGRGRRPGSQRARGVGADAAGRRPRAACPGCARTGWSRSRWVLREPVVW